jgi:hypothetical protein
MQHQNHDQILIAALAGGDLTGSELTRARTLLASCPQCTELHSDLISIAAATRTVPNLATAPRDFRLDAAQAARLARRSWLRTVLAPFGGVRSAARPLAATFTSLGLVGLLVVAVAPGLVGGAFAPTAGQDRDLAAAPDATKEAVQVPAAGGPGGAPQPAATDNASTGKDGASEGTGAGFGTDQGGTNEIHSQATGQPASQPDTSGRTSAISAPSLIFAGSLGLLVVGLLLFGLRFAARRVR